MRYAQRVKFIFLVVSVLISGLSLVLVRGKAHANGGYPWSGAVCVATGQTTGKCPNYEWSINGQTRNSSTGNYYYRNCTDYAAWRLMSVGVAVSKVSGLGNAGSWDDNASARGFSVTTSPSAGSIGVDERYGHVVFVESVNGGTVSISEYNWGSTGSYGIRSGTPSQLGLTKFVNFGSPLVSVQPSYETYGQGTGVKSARYLGTDRLSSGQQMNGNEYVKSFNTKHVLLMQPDGNLVEYGDGFRVLWNTNTQGNPGAYTVFQVDGNLVVYSSSGKPLWASGVRSGANQFIVQEDGNLVTYNSGRQPLWASGVVINDMPSYVGTDALITGFQLLNNRYMRSSDGRYSLIMQNDGNLVVYGPGHHPLWHTHTYGKPGLRFTVQLDGNLVLYNQNNAPVWASGMKPNASHLVIQTDGNLVEYSTTRVSLWHSGTFGKI